MGASSDAKGDIGMSSKGESFSDIADMDIDDNGYDDDYDYSTSIHDLGEGFLKFFCKEAAIAFFNEYGLISHQINSYNDFIKNGIQRVFDSFGEIIVEPGYDPSKKGESEWRYASVKFGKVTLGMPSFWGGSDDEKEYKMLPRHARLQNMSYASKMKVNITVEVYTQKLVSSDKFKTGKAQYLDKQILSTDTRDIIIGSVPVMVKSDLCWMKDFEKGDCDFDHGGYFIIKGAEKTFIAQEQSCLKRILITNNQGLTVAYRSEVKRHRLIIRLVGISKLENIEGVEKVLTVYFMSTEIPVWIWFFALGVSSDREVMNLIDYDSEDASISNILFASIRDADKLNDKVDGGFRRGKNALKYVDEVIRKTAFPPGESMEECISLYLFPNLKGLKQKARFLGYMVKSLLQAYAGRRKCDNRDDFRNKRLDLAGELLERELKAHIGHARRRMAKALQRDLYGDRAVRPIEHYLDASIVTNGISRAFSTGAWCHPFKRMERMSGVVATVGRANPLQTMVDMRKTRQQVQYTGKVGDARYPHPSHWGKVCFLSTPDGENCGLVKIFLFLPAIGACISFLDIALLLKKAHHGFFIAHHEWFFRCSQFASWVLLCVKEICTVSLDIIFGVSINIIRIKQASYKRSSLEDSLLSADTDVEEGCLNESGDTQSYFDLMTFRSITSVMNHGVTKQLDFEDLLQLPTDMDPCSCHDTLLSCWQSQQSSCPDPSLFRAICCAYGWPYIRLGLLKVLNDCVGFAAPLLLNKLIRFLQQGTESWDGYVLAISLGLISIFKSFLDTQYSFHLSRLKLKLRSSIITVIYQKCLYINLAERSKFTEGEIQTFMAIDSDRTVNLCNSFHDMWSLPLQIGVALFLLYTQVKFAFVAGIAITISLIPVNKWISTLIASATVKMMKQKDERIRRTGELLTYIRTLKMHGWELLFSSWLMETRSLEVMHLTTRKYLDAWCVFFWATTPTLFSLFTFGLFALMGHQLDAATVFTCLALFNTLISPLNSFPWVINGLIDAIISIKRLSRFLSCSQHKSKLETTAGSSSPYFSNDKSEIFHEDKAVVFDDSCFAWSSSDEKDLDLVLKHVTLGIPKGSFIAVIGEVGSGKSSLLNSILGEMRLVHGSVYSCGSIAYVPQVPWILSGTIRDNILFGKHYDPKRYLDTLEASALDLDISLMVGGDMAFIGEKGINLSGGQRARIALARAMYNGSDMFILDDVLSAVDAQVARCILYNAILGPLMKQQTRVLCTHNVQAISSADTIVVMDKGHVKWVGRSADWPVSSYSVFSPLNEIDICLKNESQECSAVEDIHVESQQNLVLEKDTVPASDRTQEIIEVEARKEGRVELTIYKNYATFSGWFISVVICLSAILMQASRNGNDLWLSNWVDATRSSRKEYSTSFYLVILCIFCIVNSILTLVRAFSFAFGGLRAAVKVHDTLLKRLINAPVQFFDQTPGGRILNRFSSDLYTIDDSLPFILNILLANFVGLLGIAIVLSYVQVLFLLLLLPFWYIYSKLQFFYRSTSRELRRLDSVSRSPIYTSFTETLDGSSTIRAFKSEDLFFARFTDQVKLYQQTSYTELTASLWLSLRLQLLAAFIISFVAVMAVIGSHGSLPINFSTPGLVGLALSYAAPVVSLLGSFLTSFTETEKEMVSVERALEYMDVPQEELHGSQSLHPSWPYQGQIEFQNVTLRYKPSLPAALRDISFTIEGGMQVGFIGRTGAGKSSVLNALFRLTPICKGCILVDSINIASAPIRDLRGHFSVVPQTPFLFEGSLRDNLDPFQLSDDLKIWKALERCHVKEEVEAAGGLDIHLKESGMSFSVGQRQLLCLARALLKSSKVLCLDECTANVDTQTASIIQKTISSECRGMTVITIAHRISTVLNMDSVLVLDHGILVEQGNPQVLLENESSRFSSFAKASTM